MEQDPKAPAAPVKPAEVVTEEELRKSLAALETPPAEIVPPVTPVVQTAMVAKVSDRVAAGPEELRKALEVSTVLNDFAGVVGLHVDESLGVLQKAIHEGAQRDLAVVRVLESMQKAITGLADKVEKLGAQPGAPASAAAAAPTVLKKNADGAPDPTQTRKMVLVGLEKMAKAAPMGSPEQMSVIQATAQLESTGTIGEEMLRKALAAAKG